MKKYIYKKSHVNLIVSLFDWAGTLLLSKLSIKKKVRKNIPHKILVFKPDHIGDVLLSTPVFIGLKKNIRGQ